MSTYACLRFSDCIHKIQSCVLLIKSTLVIIRNYTWQLLMDALYFKCLRKDSYDMNKPFLTPALMQECTCYWNPLGSSTTYVDVQKKLNVLKNLWEQNPLMCKWPGQNVYQFGSQVLIHTHLHILWCEWSPNNIVLLHQFRD